ncbi:apolipoprotein N-acyltransferase [Deinococcus sonorensis]|uniref:Apolipoprotein N-acyltransferase n=2 Tax=Deinococcus sonorensis TaxID=309891 RepID=A0AAU7U9T1_9DEIO
MPALFTVLLSLLLGAALALCGLPQPWSALTPLPLAAVLYWIAGGPRPRQVAGRAFWTMSAYFAVQLWWLARFAADLSGLGTGGELLMIPLYLIEGGFWAVMAALCVWRLRDRLARVLALAGGWVVLEWLRTLGPLAFPWSGMGYTLLPSPLVQTADLWGALGLSVLVSATAAAVVAMLYRRWRLPLGMALIWLLGLGYGLSRMPAAGPQQRALLVRTNFDSFGKASGSVGPEEQMQRLLQLSSARQPGELTIWSETAVSDPSLLPLTPAPGIYGVRDRNQNTVQTWNGLSQGPVIYQKLKPVPFGEYYLFAGTEQRPGPLRPIYLQIFRLLNLGFANELSGGVTSPLEIEGGRYGAYVCYDSIFSWVTRQLARNGAEVLVNVSNDGWYRGWGVVQHFQMGRVRAIETRRWMLRSVNAGIVAVVDDLGHTRQQLSAGEGVLHARYPLLEGQTVYVRLGDAPALILALLLFLPAIRAERRARWQRL